MLKITLLGEPCPICKSMVIKILRCLDGWKVYCTTCKCCGPLGNNETEAVSKWNKPWGVDVNQKRISNW